MKKFTKLFLLAVLAFSTCACLSSCKLGCRSCKKEEPIDPNATYVEVKVYEAGYGVAWLEQAIEKFNELYKQENYIVKITSSEGTNSSETLSYEIKDIARNTTDIYFINGVNIPYYLEASQSIRALKGNVLLEDLTSVYESKAIKFDKTEENVTIESKLNESDARAYKYNDTSDARYASYVGNYFAFPWANGASGIYANKNILKDNNWEAPRTTDEMFAQYKSLMTKVRDTNIYPVTFAGGNAMGYWLYLFDTFFAQYSGADAERNFWNLPLTEDGYKAYEDQGILESLKVIAEMTDETYAKAGSNKLGNMQSQGELINNKALYTCNGNWIYNEMKKENPVNVNNIIMIKTPVISALGTKLGITDSKLSDVVKGIDDGKDNQTVSTENGVSIDVVQTVRNARSVYFNSSVDHSAIIPTYSEEKEVAKLFLRFLASDDNLDLYKATTNSALPFNYATSSKHQPNEFEASVESVRSGVDKVLLYEDKFTSPMRRTAKIQCFGNQSDPDIFKFLSQNTKSPEEVFNDLKKYVTDSWSGMLKTVK